MRPDSSICVLCKGSRLLCGLKRCPLLQKYYIEQETKYKIDSITSKSSIFGPTPPNIFVGRYGYPTVRLGPLVNLFADELSVEKTDNIPSWFGLSIEEIIKYRSYLFRPLKRRNVKLKQKGDEDKETLTIQESILSIRPIDVEIKIDGKPKLEVSFSSYLQPMGPYAKLKEVKICENPKIPKEVDEIVDEKMKAVQSINFLFENKFDIYYITKVLSAGIVGLEKKFVPTRWAITAVDDITSKFMISKIKECQPIDGIFVGSSEYLSNHFEVLIIPGNWEFENFEAWAPGTLWSQGLSKPVIVEEYEGFYGRKDYAESQAGGYYASRYAASEFLYSKRRQAKIIVFREIYEGYQVPLGVWVVRETAKKAYTNLRKFQTLKEAIADISSRLRNDVKLYLSKSKILPQTKLTEF